MDANYLALLNDLARLRGLGEAYYDHRGELYYFSPNARRAILQAMGLAVHDATALQAALDLNVPTNHQHVATSTPLPCYQPRVFDTRKCWGISVQLYTLRSVRNWGSGDFNDLCELIELAAPLGCDVIGVNPLHALFPADPSHCSPYSPSSRLFLNIFYIAVDAIPEFSNCTAVQELCAQVSFQAALVALRASNDVMYEQVSALKLGALRLLFDDFRNSHLANNSSRGQAFRNFVTQRGQPLRLHALFDTLDEYFRQQTPARHGWRSWPDEYLDPNSDAVSGFAVEREYEIEFFMYAQWLADEQLAAAQQLARDQGMRIGLYGDLAVGANPAGAEVWSNQFLYVQNASIGAPPDPLALNGQDWGIPPIDPLQLRAQNFAPFAELVRANMRNVGALRIDHVMSLFRLWWVPKGFSAIEGVYVHYPLDELVTLLAQASNQAQCLVIGEDLGTVPDEVRRAMDEYQLYQYKVLLFEKHGDRFKTPGEYAKRAVATATTHDLPPLKAWWQGDDLALRDRLNLYPSKDTAQRLHDERTTDRHALMRALHAAGLWQWQAQEALPEFSPALAHAVHLYLGASDAALVLVQLEDLIGMTDPVNVPGTHIEHANWQRKLTLTTAEIFALQAVQEGLNALGQERAKQ
jgi:4-alpha-glucanotransferase